MEFKKIEMSFLGHKVLCLHQTTISCSIQDQVYNAIQEIAARGKYDFVLDKSSDLIMLYSNKKYDISAQVVQSILKNEKQEALNQRKRIEKKRFKPWIQTYKRQEASPERSSFKSKGSTRFHFKIQKGSKAKALQNRDIPT